MRWNCEEFVDPSKHRCYMKQKVNQEEDEAANNKSNNDDLKSVWYRFGSLRNTVDPSNRIMAECLLITITRLRRSILFFNDLKRYQTVHTATF